MYSSCGPLSDHKDRDFSCAAYLCSERFGERIKLKDLISVATERRRRHERRRGRDAGRRARRRRGAVQLERRLQQVVHAHRQTTDDAQ